MKINLVIDNPKSWFNSKALKLKKQITVLGHECQILNNQQKIKPATYITFFLSCEKYITPAAQAKSRFNIVIHASNLPKGKGMSPATWQILEGKNKINLTLFEVAEKIDAGKIYLKNSFKLNGSELIDEWQEKLYLCLEKMVIEFLKKIKTVKPVSQSGTSSYYRRRTKTDSQLNPNKTLTEQFNLLRVVDNEKYPAYFYFKKHKYLVKIYKEL